MANNTEFEKGPSIEDIVDEEETEGIAIELLREFKENNKRMDAYNKKLIGTIKVMSISFALAIVAIIAVIFIYLYQYDFESYSQDGSGYNNINTGTQGDVNNGTEIPGTQEEGQ